MKIIRFKKDEIKKTRKFLQGMHGNEGRYISDDEVKDYLKVVSNLKK
nr:MAG TPA: hypothetical protein [Caudoviricetes sp.]